MKKIFTAFITTVLLLSACIFANAEIIASGTCGDDVMWAYDTDDVLTVFGIGEMENYEVNESLPWEEYTSSAKELVILDGVTSVYSGMLSFMHSIERIELSASVTDFECNDWDCYLLEEIVVDENNPVYSSVDGVLFNNVKKSIAIYPRQKPDEYYKVPDRTEIVETGCFANRSAHLVHIELPDSVTEIEDQAFWMGTLEKLTMGKNVKRIGNTAFWKCRSLKEVVMSENLEIIDSGAFEECTALTSIVLPEGVKTIESLAFYKCSALERIYIPESVTEIGQDVFECGAFAKYDDFTICGVPGSVAESYANEYGYIFEGVVKESENITEPEHETKNESETESEGITEHDAPAAQNSPMMIVLVAILLVIIVILVLLLVLKRKKQ